MKHWDIDDHKHGRASAVADWYEDAVRVWREHFREDRNPDTCIPSQGQFCNAIGELMCWPVNERQYRAADPTFRAMLDEHPSIRA